MREWPETRLSEFVETTSGGTPNRKESHYFGGDIPWVKSGELEDSFIHDTEEKLTDAGLQNSSAKLLPAGTLLMAMYGATVGKTAILRISATTNQAVCAIIPNADRADVEYLRFALIYQRREILKQRYGGAQPNISQQIIRNLSVPLPALAEQRKIAGVLGFVRRAMGQEERLLALTAQLKKALLYQLFTHGLRGESQKDTEIGLIPESWQAVPLGSCCDIVSGSMSYTDFLKLPSTDAADAVECMGVKVSDMNLPGNESTFTTANVAKRLPRAIAHRKLIPPKTVVFPKRGAAIATNKKRLTATWTVLDPNLIGLRPKTMLDPDFLFCWSHTFDLRRITDPGPTPQLNKKDLSPLLFPLPPDGQEQREIAEAIGAVDAKTVVHQRYHTALSELFRTLLHQLMTAHIRVHNLELPELLVEAPE